MIAKSMSRAAVLAVLAVTSAACAGQDAAGKARVVTAAHWDSSVTQSRARPEPGARAQAWPLLDGDRAGSGNGRRGRFIWDEGVAMPEPAPRAPDSTEPDLPTRKTRGDGRDAAVIEPAPVEPKAANEAPAAAGGVTATARRAR